MPERIKNMKKIIRIGTSRETYSVYCSIEIKDGRLSISGVEGPNHYGGCRGGCGQIDMHIDNEYLNNLNFAPGWNKKLAKRFLTIWEEWHLNDLQAGCEHQRNLGWNNDNIGEPCPECGYKNKC